MKLKADSLNQARGVAITIDSENLDAGNVKAFKGQVQPHLDNHLLAILDMSALKFVDSSGLGALLSCRRIMSNKGGQFVLVGLTKPVRAVIETVRMHRVFSIYDTLQEAKTSFSVTERPL